MAYQVKTPWWLRAAYSNLTWRMPADGVYLTFDDGPHEKATPFVLEQLAKYDAKATFFCIGKNVSTHPDIYHRIIAEGHKVGNHTNDHLNGWKTDTEAYLANIKEAAKLIEGKLFRPPYGRIKRVQAGMLLQAKWKICMWDVLSGDFDTEITPEKCLTNVIKNVQPGSIVVFHDSEKAWSRMSYALPRVLEFCRAKNWDFKVIPQE